MFERLELCTVLALKCLQKYENIQKLAKREQETGSSLAEWKKRNNKEEGEGRGGGIRRMNNMTVPTTQNDRN